MKLLINQKQESCENANICYVCQEMFDDKNKK